MSEILLKAIIEKLETLEIRIQQINEARQEPADYTIQLEEIKAEAAKIQSGLDTLRVNSEFPRAMVQQLSRQLKDCATTLRKPVQQDVLHHHHVTKGIAISVSLVLLLVICASWIFNLYQRIHVYRANDIKYRHLKLQVNKPLQAILYGTDSLYCRFRTK